MANLNLSNMSERVRFNRVQKELAQIGIAFDAEPSMCRCCVTADYLNGRNKHLDVTRETPYLFNGYGVDTEWSFNRNGDLLVQHWDEEVSPWSDMYLSHRNMTDEMWGKASEIFSKYGFSMERPESEGLTGYLYA